MYTKATYIAELTVIIEQLQALRLYEHASCICYTIFLEILELYWMKKGLTCFNFIFYFLQHVCNTVDNLLSVTATDQVKKTTQTQWGSKYWNFLNVTPLSLFIKLKASVP